MALTNYTFIFNGLTIGAGTPFQIIDIDGLESLPELRVQDDNRGFNDGAFTGRDFYNGRTITMTVHTFAGNGNTAFDNFDLFQQAFLPQQTGTQTMQFLLSTSDTEKQIDVRMRSRKTLIDPEYTFGYIRSQISMFAPDPRYYDNVAQTTSLTLPTSPIGRGYSRTFSYTYGGGTLTNYGYVTNAGWVYTSPTIYITGPITNPAVGNATTNQVITVNATLGSGDVLSIDLNAKLVTLNGSAARNLVAVGSQWFTCAPGSTSLYLSGSGSGAGTTATINYRNAYI